MLKTMLKLTEEELRKRLELRRSNAAQPHGKNKYSRKIKHRSQRYEK